MKLKIGILTIFLSVIFILFSFFFYSQASYNNKVRKYFLEKVPVTTDQLKNISLSSDKNVLITGVVSPENFFLTESGKRVVAHYHKEEIKNKNSSRWNIVKDATFLRAIPFTLNDKFGYVVIDNLNIDRTYLCEQNSKIENFEKDKVKQISECLIEVNAPITVFGRVENKAGQTIITNPNIASSLFSLNGKEPFIVTTYSTQHIVQKSFKIARSVYFVTFGIFAVGVLTLINIIVSLMKKEKQA